MEVLTHTHRSTPASPVDPRQLPQSPAVCPVRTLSVAGLERMPPEGHSTLTHYDNPQTPPGKCSPLCCYDNQNRAQCHQAPCLCKGEGI